MTCFCPHHPPGGDNRGASQLVSLLLSIGDAEDCICQPGCAVDGPMHTAGPAFAEGFSPASAGPQLCGDVIVQAPPLPAW